MSSSLALTSTPSPSVSAQKGSATITGICVWENQRSLDTKNRNRIIVDGQFFVPGASVDSTVVGMYQLYNDGSLDLGNAPGAFFITAVVSENSPEASSRILTLSTF